MKPGLSTKGALLLCVGAAAVLAACTSGPGSQHPDPSPATLQVHIGLFGGPPRPGGGMALSDAPQRNARVVVTNEAGRKWTAKTDAAGLATFSVQPGRYDVASPPCGPASARHVTVEAGQVARVEVRCAVP